MLSRTSLQVRLGQSKGRCAPVAAQSWRSPRRSVLVALASLAVLFAFASARPSGASAASGWSYYCGGVRSANSWCEDIARVVWANQNNYEHPNDRTVLVCQKINSLGGYKITESCGNNVTGQTIGNCCNYSRYALIGNPYQDHAWTMHGTQWYYF